MRSVFFRLLLTITVARSCGGSRFRPRKRVAKAVDPEVGPPVYAHFPAQENYTDTQRTWSSSGAFVAYSRAKQVATITENIVAGKNHQLSVLLKQGEAILFAVRVQDKDIGFEVLYTDESHPGSDPIPLIGRIFCSHDQELRGVWKPDQHFWDSIGGDRSSKAVTVTFVFVNSYSWFTAKDFGAAISIIRRRFRPGGPQHARQLAKVPMRRLGHAMLALQSRLNVPSCVGCFARDGQRKDRLHADYESAHLDFVQADLSETPKAFVVDVNRDRLPTGVPFKFTDTLLQGKWTFKRWLGMRKPLLNITTMAWYELAIADQAAKLAPNLVALRFEEVVVDGKKKLRFRWEGPVWPLAGQPIFFEAPAADIGKWSCTQSGKELRGHPYGVGLEYLVPQLLPTLTPDSATWRILNNDGMNDIFFSIFLDRPPTAPAKFQQLWRSVDRPSVHELTVAWQLHDHVPMVQLYHHARNG